MSAYLTPLLHGLAVVLAVLGVQGPGTLLATLGAAALMATLAALLIAVVRSALAARPRHTAVGARARRHAILLGRLPDMSHPDAAGHVRSRAPGRVASAA